MSSALGDHALAGELDWMGFQGSFQPLRLCDSVPNAFCRFSLVFPAAADIILQTPGRVLRFETGSPACSTTLSKEPIRTAVCRSDLRRAHSAVNDQMFVVTSLEAGEKSMQPSVPGLLLLTGSALLQLLIPCILSREGSAVHVSAPGCV